MSNRIGRAAVFVVYVRYYFSGAFRSNKAEGRTFYEERDHPISRNAAARVDDTEIGANINCEAGQFNAI
ncbi:MAG: hypothetical protein ACM3JG_20990 [Thiohalocapsa sp.]